MHSSEFKKYTDSAYWFELTVPASWSCQREENCHCFYDEMNGVGALQLTAYEFPPDEDVDPKSELLNYLETSNFKYSEAEINFTDLEDRREAQVVCLDQSEGYWEIWRIVEKNKFFFITYNCDLQNQSIELDKVKQIVLSLEVVG